MGNGSLFPQETYIYGRNALLFSSSHHTKAHQAPRSRSASPTSSTHVLWGQVDGTKASRLSQWQRKTTASSPSLAIHSPQKSAKFTTLERSRKPADAPASFRETEARGLSPGWHRVRWHLRKSHLVFWHPSADGGAGSQGNLGSIFFPPLIYPVM